MKQIKSFVLVAFAIVTSFMFSVPADIVSAQSASLSIAPRKDYVTDPGETIKDTLLIRNLDETDDLELTLRVVDFTYTEDGGTPKLFLDPDAAQTTWSLKPFLKVPNSVKVPVKGTKSVPITLSVPEGQGAGSFYSAIIYSTGAPGGGNVGLSASGVTLVFSQVPGKVNENLQLKKLGAYDAIAALADDDDGYRFLNFLEPLNIGYTLKNSGNVVEAPVGTIKLQHMFGQETSITNINPTKSLALIGQTRTFTACIKLKSQEVDFSGEKSEATNCVPPGLWPGHYNVSIEAYYGQNGNNTQEVIGTASFWYLPPWFLFLIAVLLLIIAFYVWKIKRSLDRRKRRAGVKFNKSRGRK